MQSNANISSEKKTKKHHLKQNNSPRPPVEKDPKSPPLRGEDRMFESSTVLALANFGRRYGVVTRISRDKIPVTHL